MKSRSERLACNRYWRRMSPGRANARRVQHTLGNLHSVGGLPDVGEEGG